MNRQKLGKTETHFVCQKEYYLHKNTAGRVTVALYYHMSFPKRLHFELHFQSF